jgi:hypothetical protein
VQSGCNALPHRRCWPPLVALCLVRICHLLHAAFECEQPSERRAPITPVPPGIGRPILVIGALRGSRVETKGVKQKCISLLRVGLRNCITLVALGESGKGIRLTRVRPFLVPHPGLCEIRREFALPRAV